MGGMSGAGPGGSRAGEGDPVTWWRRYRVSLLCCPQPLQSQWENALHTVPPPSPLPLLPASPEGLGMEEPARLQSMGLQKVGHSWVTSLTFPIALCGSVFQLLWPCISFRLPFSLCSSHCMTWYLVGANFTSVKNEMFFYLMNGNIILEHILLLPGIHSQDWSMYFTSLFPYCEYLCFHLWESPWGWDLWSQWGLICISSLLRNSAWSCPGVLWSWNHRRVPELGGNTQMKSGSERWSS